MTYAHDRFDVKGKCLPFKLFSRYCFFIIITASIIIISSSSREDCVLFDLARSSAAAESECGQEQSSVNLADVIGVWSSAENSRRSLQTPPSFVELTSARTGGAYQTAVNHRRENPESSRYSVNSHNADDCLTGIDPKTS